MTTTATLQHAAQLQALLRAIERAARALLDGTTDTTDRAAVADAGQELAALASIARDRTDSLAAALIGAA